MKRSSPNRAQTNALRVSPIEWSLAACIVVLAACGFAFEDYAGLSMVIEAILGISLVLAFSGIKSAFQSRTIGKAVLTSSMVFYYWLEAHYLVWTDPPFSVLNAPMNTSQYELPLLQEGLLYVALFQVALLVGYSINPRLAGPLRWVRRRTESPTRFAAAVRYVLACSGVLAMLLSYSFDLGTALDAALASRSRTVLPSVDIGPLLYLGYFSFFAASYFLIRIVAMKDRRPWVWLGALVALLPSLLSGTRHYLAYIAFPVLAVAVTRIKGRISRGRVLKWCAAGVLLLLLCQVQVSVRTQGWEHLNEVAVSDLANLNVAYQFSAALFALHLVPDQHDYFHEWIEPHFIYYWVPRFFWPEKPVIRSWTYYNETYTRSSTAWNVTPSVIGQFHMNWGLPGVIFAGMWLGFLAWATDLLFSAVVVDSQPAMASALGMAYAFISCSFRFYSPMYFSYFVFGVIGMLLVTRRKRGAALAAARVSGLPAATAA